MPKEVRDDLEKICGARGMPADFVADFLNAVEVAWEVASFGETGCKRDDSARPVPGATFFGPTLNAPNGA